VRACERVGVRACQLWCPGPKKAAVHLRRGRNQTRSAACLLFASMTWCLCCAWWCVQIEAQLNPGRLLMFFDLEKPDGAPAAAGARAEADEDERITGKKRARDEPGPNKKKREKVMVAGGVVFARVTV